MASVRFSSAILSSSSAMTSIKDLLNSEKVSNGLKKEGDRRMKAGR